MPTWPRDVLPQTATDFAFPGALKSRSQSGVWNTRSITNVGRTWRETYFLKISDTNPNGGDAELLVIIRQYWREGTIFDIDHRSYLTQRGVGGGTPLVNGASQTGSSLVVDGAPLSTTGWLLAGDIIKIAGINLVYDVTAQVDTDGAGNATIPISPEIFSGGSPADGAAVTISGVLVRALIAEPPELPTVGAAEFGIGRVSFAEAP